MLKARLPLELVQADALLEERLHLAAHDVLALELGPHHRLLLQLHSLFLFHDDICLLFKVDEYLVLLLDFLFLIDDFLAQSILERHKMVWIPREALVGRRGTVQRLADWKVLPIGPREYRCLQLRVQCFSLCDDLFELSCRLCLQKD